MKIDLIAIGGTADHVHLLVRLTATVSVAELVKQVKGSSSHMVNHSLSGADEFKWQGLYAAFTIARQSISSVRSYIQNQEEHHRNGSLHAELEVSCENE